MGILKNKMRIFILLLALCAIANTTPLRQIMTNFQVPQHYQKPQFRSPDRAICYSAGSKETDVLVWLFADHQYGACMSVPYDDQKSKCVTGAPPGNTAIPAAIYNKDCQILCGLVCSGRALGMCAPGSECMVPAGQTVGYCFYHNTRQPHTSDAISQN